MSTPRRVLFLTDVFHGVHGGTEGQVAAWLERLAPGWEAELWVLFAADYLGTQPFPCPWRVIGLPPRRNPLHRARLRRLGREVRAGRFDLIHAFHATTCTLAPQVGRLADVPVVTSRRDLGYWQTPARVERLRRANRDVLGIVSNSAAAAARAVDVEWAHPRRVHVVPNGLDLDRLAGPRHPTLREEHGIPADAPVVGLLANHRPLKRPQDLVAALEKLGDAAGDAHLLFVGHHYPEGFADTAPATLRGRVHVRPVLGDVGAVLRHLDVGVLCSESEGLSNAILEYMGCGLPVVATDVGGNPELVEDGKTGLLYAAGDVDALAGHLARLLGKADVRQRLGTAAAKRAAEVYALPRMVDGMTAIHEAVVSDWETKPPRDVTWSWIEDVAALEPIAEAWDALADAHHFFAAPGWVRTWLAWSGRPPRVLVAHDATGALVAVLPLAELRPGVLGFAGQDEGADHLDLVAVADRALPLARGALREVAGRRWRRVEWKHLREDGALRLALHDPRRPVPFVERASTVCPYAAADSWDAYLATNFSRKRRHELRRSVRRFLEQGDVRVVHVTRPDEVPAAIDRLFALHAERFAALGSETAFAGEGLRAFHLRLATHLAESGRLLLAFLEAEDRPLAVYYGFRFGGKLYFFQGGMANVEGGTSPGTVLRAQLLENDVFGGGLAEADFLDGDESFKLRWATGTRRLFDVALYPATVPGRARAAAADAKQRAVATLKRKLRRS